MEGGKKLHVGEHVQRGVPRHGAEQFETKV